MKALQYLQFRSFPKNLEKFDKKNGGALISDIQQSFKNFSTRIGEYESWNYSVKFGNKNRKGAKVPGKRRYAPGELSNINIELRSELIADKSFV